MKLNKVDAQNIKWILETIPGLTVAEIAEAIANHTDAYRIAKAMTFILDNVVSTQAQIMNTRNENIYMSMAKAYGAFLDQELIDDDYEEDELDNIMRDIEGDN